MLKFGGIFKKIPHSNVQWRRCVSALYVTGDKAKEQYSVLKPYMNFEGTFANRDSLEFTIAKRKMDINLASVLEKYEKFKKLNEKITDIEQQRASIAKEIKKEISEGETDNALKEKGKELRNALKALKEESYPIEDDFVHSFLNLPNELHPDCPIDGKEKLLYRSSVPRCEQGVSHMERKDLINVLDDSCYYLQDEAAEFDVDATHAMAYTFVQKAEFLPISNPDFVRCILLEAATTPTEAYHLVKEEHLQNSINAAFLTGGATFEGFLGAVAKLSVYPSVVPLRLVGTGRNYDINKTKSSSDDIGKFNLYTTTQTNAVVPFVAAADAAQADAEMENILNLVVDFYKVLDVHFRIYYADASCLTPAESLRAVIELYSPAEQRYIAVGHVSNYTDFISKRILFNMRDQSEYKFMHLVGGPILYTSRLIAVLLEHGRALNNCDLLCAANERPFRKDLLKAAIEEFRNTVN